VVGRWTDEQVADAIARYYLSGGQDQWIGGVPDLQEMERFGREQGYPECCIREFIADIAADRRPAELRGLVPGGYVPCSACAVLATALSS
jgi:hypothetical protein